MNMIRYMLGLLYFQGNGVPRDYKEAEKWIRKAAARGETAGQYLLGAMYVEGLGVPKDNVKAYMWLTMAGDSTDKQSRYLNKAIELRDSLNTKMTS